MAIQEKTIKKRKVIGITHEGWIELDEKKGLERLKEQNKEGKANENNNINY